ncbi:cytochrome c oxidase subunit II [Massilia putida]|uniref:cytochrome c oxidase subunit II n=1 Tax=Massilia putida TaxID=1141883 RepID=UPI000B26E890|nr:cytochrome c oxidase subunit II [Massilia putida]
MEHARVPGVTSMQDALRAAGAQAGHIGDLWNGTLALCTFVFVAIVVATIIAVWCAPRADAATRPDTSSLDGPEHRIWCRIGWATGTSVAGLLVLLAGDVFTSRALARLPLRDAVNIELVGHQWWWEARYLDADASREFTTANELTIPVGRPVIVTLRADDVIHSLWVPNLGGKKDLIPGRTATLQLRADRAGTYRGQCAEFCGLEHALMALLVHAVPTSDYEAWAANQRGNARDPADAAARRGRDVFLGASCAKCHAVAGTPAQGRMGPDLTHLASRRTIAAGIFPNNRGHLAGWIADPQALKPGVNMPANTLPPDDLQALLTYLETLR